MWRDTAVSRCLQLAAPIIQGPFGSGLSSVALSTAVSEAGGLGSFGVHHLDGAAIGQTAAAIRARTAKPFALNLWLPHPSEQHGLEADEFDATLTLFRPYFAELGLEPPPPAAAPWPSFEEQLEAVLQARPAVFSFVYGVPSAEALEQCRRRGILTLGTATTVAEAKALEAAGVDMLVASGCEAGGHRVAFLRPPEDGLIGGLALIPQVVDAVRIPVIAAGGIADGRGIAAALCLGAQGVQIGTAFLACRESGASELHRQALFGPQASDTALTRAFSGRLARGLRNRLLEELNAHQARLPGYPVQGQFAAALKPAALAQGRDDLLALWCGQAAALLEQRDAGALWHSLLAQTDRLLDR
ncbi:NAD(P)H-dependent flavin oxidoreductase [Pseudomonas sp. MBLB4123]|uniref:NAD(P)H-dependent flavin oxidoreductase n=1 Tax=Pseudomonas sp. MBLB4123 TaxID=3451557 RepID=UPI003F7569DA